MDKQTWHPISEKPESLGRYRINDVFSHITPVRWDGRHFRYEGGQFDGRVVAHYKGDMWQLVEESK
ncbi:hypothetical protein [Cupriavidus taiwanensis]|uniref:hypothetical protein n=1 Tax=Cupriavidus taiwanensis TaxID=164546 RepID=UPI000E150B72|nr:hypothetical protein [Cupriavidus taiwanensis]SPA44625.1 hypothetical protein CBM2629_A150427 [Cupriavidus taiwanensis]